MLSTVESTYRMREEDPKNPIQFIRPNRDYSAPSAKLTASHALQKVANKQLIQVLLDNCSIQRMEHIFDLADKENRDATKEDVIFFGLGPLLELLESTPIAMSATGLCEMPGGKVGKAHRSYERFCFKFWPTHSDDKDACYNEVQRESNEQKITFNDLPDNSRRAYGSAYLAFMQYQHIYRCFEHLTPEKKFEAYLYGMVEYLDVISAFELEVIKYLFWDESPRVLEGLPPSVRARKKRIKKNFGNAGTSIHKCRYLAFDRAMDVNWLTMGNVSEDVGECIDINGVNYSIECWVGTTDQKLFDICQDIHSTPGPDSVMRMLAVNREKEMSRLPYWRCVDGLAQNVLFQRYSRNIMSKKPFDVLSRIDSGIVDIERNLTKLFSE